MFLSHESLYGKLFPPELFPANYLHDFDGHFRDADLAPLTREEAMALAETLPYYVPVRRH